MKKLILLLLFSVSLSGVLLAGQSSPLAESTHQSRIVSKPKAAKLEKLKAKVYRKIEKKGHKKRVRKDKNDRLRLALLANKLSIGGLIGTLVLSGMVLAGFFVMNEAIIVLGIIGLFASSLLLFAGGLIGLIMWIIENREDSPNPEVLKYAKRAALIYLIPQGISLVLSLVSTIASAI